MASFSRRSDRGINIWPGFVDALAALLMVIMFLLLVFVVSEFYLRETLSGRDEALEQLNQQVSELADLLALERKANADLRINVARLSSELQSSLAARDQLEMKLGEARSRAETAEAELAEARAEAESLRADIETLRQVRDDLEAQVGELAGRLDSAREDLSAARDRSKELQARLSTAEERTHLAQQEIEEKAIRLRATQESLEEEEKLTAQQRSQMALLNQQIAALRQQLATVSKALEASEAKVEEQKVQIADLGKRLNVALAGKVQELARYRSEFFGRLKEIVGEREDIRIVGDRFVFQSEVLFDTASAQIEEQGRQKLANLADTLKEIAGQIPESIHWILQVDGHTDIRPISTERFPSNWELSTARAISVVRFLVEQGIPAEHLAATGYGEFQPLEEGTDEAALRRNRRIELKLTQR